MGVRGRADWIREHYQVPAKVGMTIRVAGMAARITGFRDQYLLCRFLDEPVLGLRVVHPTWSVEYPPFDT